MPQLRNIMFVISELLCKRESSLYISVKIVGDYNLAVDDRKN